MEWVKRLIIWLIGVFAGIVLSNLAVGTFMEFISQEPAIIKYVEKGESLIRPEIAVTHMDDPDKISAVLSLRSLVDDVSIAFDDTFALRFERNTSVDFSCVDGDDRLTGGTWVPVCRGEREKLSTLKDTIGLVCIDRLCEMSYAKELQGLLAKEPNAALRLDRYLMDGYIVTPLEITVMDREGRILGSLTDALGGVGPAGNMLTASDVFLYNAYDAAEFLENGDYSILEQMKRIRRGGRDVDLRSVILIEGVNFDLGDDNDRERKLRGFGFVRHEMLNVEGDYAMAVVSKLSFMIPALLASFFTIVVWTGILFIIGMVKRK